MRRGIIPREREERVMGGGELKKKGQLLERGDAQYDALNRIKVIYKISQVYLIHSSYQ